jgi:hypothetical protein
VVAETLTMARIDSSTGLMMLAGVGWACAFAAVAIAWPGAGDDAIVRSAVFAAFGGLAGAASTWLRLRFDPPRLAPRGMDSSEPLHAAVPAAAAPADVDVGELVRMEPSLASDTAPMAH